MVTTKTEKVKPERFLSVETAGGPTWDPKGEVIAFVHNAPGVFQIYKTKIIEGFQLWPTRLTFERDRCTSPKFLSDGSLLFSRDHGGNENYQIGHIDKNMELVWLSSDLEAKHLIQVVGQSRYYFAANLKDRSRLDVYEHRLPVRENEPDLIYSPERGLCRAETLGLNESKLILQKFLGNMEQELVLYENGETIELTRALTQGKKTRWESIKFIDPETLLVATDFKSDFKRLALLSLNGDFTTIEQIEKNLSGEFEEAACSNYITTMFYFVNEDGYSSLYQGDFRSDGSADIQKFDLPVDGCLVVGDARSFNRGSSLTTDGLYLAVTLASPTIPTNIWILQTQKGRWWQVTKTNTAGLSPDQFVKATLHHYQSFDGLNVPYFKYIPKGDKPKNGWPTIIMIHGGPESQIRPNFNPVIQFFVAAGFAVVTPNIRGSSGYGRRYLDLDNREKRLDAIKDIKQLALALKKDSEIDGDRLVIYGGSYGGFAVLSAMTEYPELWKAGVDIVGISNFVTFLENTAAWRRPLREAEYGSLGQDRELLERISPLNKVDQISAPLFIIQGDNDERVPLSESLQIYEKVKAKNIPVRLLRFADEGHGIAKLENRLTAYSEVLEWLQEIVQSFEKQK